MRVAATILTGMILLAGCAHAPEAYDTDAGWGQAQERSWAQVVAFPEGRQPEATPEGVSGIVMEETMGVYQKTIAEKPTKTPVFQLGVVGGR